MHSPPFLKHTQDLQPQGPPLAVSLTGSSRPPSLTEVIWSAKTACLLGKPFLALLSVTHSSHWQTFHQRVYGLLRVQVTRANSYLECEREM